MPASRARPWSRGCLLLGTGTPGTSGTPRMSRVMRPSTRRSGPELPATSLITTRNTARPWALAPVRIVTVEPEELICTPEVGQLPRVDDGGLRVAHPWGEVAGQVDGLGLAGLQRGDPDRGQRRRRRADDADPDAVGEAVVGGHPEGAGVAGRGRRRGRHLDDALVGCPRAQPRVGLVVEVGGPLEPRDLRRVGRPDVAQRADVDRTDSACATSMGSSGQRRMGRVSPTCTGTDKIALMPSGSSTETPVVTSKTTAPGPAYDAAAETRKLPSSTTVAVDLGAWRGPHPALQREADRAARRVGDVVGQVDLALLAGLEPDQCVGLDERQAGVGRWHVERPRGGSPVGVLDPERDDHGLLGTLDGDATTLDPRGDAGRGVDVGDHEVLEGPVGVVGAAGRAGDGPVDDWAGGEHVGRDRATVAGRAERVGDDRRVVVARLGAQGQRGLGAVEPVGQPIDDLDAPAVDPVGCVDLDRPGRRSQPHAGGRVHEAERDPAAGGDQVVGEHVDHARAARRDGDRVGDRERWLGWTGWRDGDAGRADRRGAEAVGDPVGELVGADAGGVGGVLDRVGADADHPAPAGAESRPMIVTGSPSGSTP